MKGLKKGLAMLLVLVACLALTTMAFAAEYTVRPGSSIRVSLTQSGNGGIDGNVTVRCRMLTLFELLAESVRIIADVQERFIIM